MGWLVDRVEDGDALEGSRERMCPWVDHSYAADAFCGSSSLVAFFAALMGPDL